MKSLLSSIKLFDEKYGLKVNDIPYLTIKEREFWHNSDAAQISSSLRRSIVSRSVDKIYLALLYKTVNAIDTNDRPSVIIIIRYAVIRTLILIGLKSHAINMSKKLITKCAQYGYIHEGLVLSNYLVINSSFLSGEQLGHFKKLALKFAHDIHIDQQIRFYYAELENYFNKSKSISHQFNERLEEIIENIKRLKPQIPNSNFITFKYLIYLAAAEYSCDLSKYLEICNCAINELSELNYNRDSGLRIFANKRSNVLMRFKKYSEAEAYLKIKINETKEYSRIWFYTNQTILICLLKQMKLDEAHLLCARFENIDLKAYDTELRDRFYLIKFYLSLYYPSTMMYQNGIANQLPRYFNDRSGMNVSIIIADLLDDIMSGKYNQVDSHTNYVKEYIGRNMKNNPRSKLFIRLILNLNLAKTNWNRFVNQNNRLYGRMIVAKDQVEDIEIMNYELIWPVIIKHVLGDMKRYKALIESQIVERHYQVSGINK